MWNESNRGIKWQRDAICLQYIHTRRSRIESKALYNGPRSGDFSCHSLTGTTFNFFQMQKSPERSKETLAFIQFCLWPLNSNDPEFNQHLPASQSKKKNKHTLQKNTIYCRAIGLHVRPRSSNARVTIIPTVFPYVVQGSVAGFCKSNV